MKFKVGDRVRRITKPHSQMPVGSVFEIEEILDTSWGGIRLQFANLDGVAAIPDYFELVKTDGKLRFNYIVSDNVKETNGYSQWEKSLKASKSYTSITASERIGTLSQMRDILNSIQNMPSTDSMIAYETSVYERRFWRAINGG